MSGMLPDGIELRFPLEITVDTEKLRTYVCVAGGEVMEEQSDTCTPSLVLRRIGSEESLWDLAKKHRTTCKAILEINELQDEAQISQGRLLLIPKRY